MDYILKTVKTKLNVFIFKYQICKKKSKSQRGNLKRIEKKGLDVKRRT